MFGKIAKWGLTLIGVWLIGQGLITVFFVEYSFSKIFPSVLGVILIVLVWGIGRVVGYLNKTKYAWARYIIYGMVGVFAASFIMMESLIIFDQNQEPSKSDAVIVLGAGLRGDQPSLSLVNRLDCAADYLNTYPTAIAVVSGGQGTGETVTEAFAMKRILIEKGIQPDRIVMEDKSTSTLENFKFSKEILDKRFNDNYNVSYVTNKYHVYRAGLVAERAGLEASGIAAEDVSSVKVSTYCREYFALMKYFIFS